MLKRRAGMHEKMNARIRICRAIGRQRPGNPALGDAPARVQGLLHGADDYPGKPFEPDELRLRILALVRRHATAAPPSHILGLWRYEPESRALVGADDKFVILPPAEARVLDALLARQGFVRTRDALIEQARGRGFEISSRAIDVLVSR